MGLDGYLPKYLGDVLGLGRAGLDDGPGRVRRFGYLTTVHYIYTYIGTCICLFNSSFKWGCSVRDSWDGQMGHGVIIDGYLPGYI